MLDRKWFRSSKGGVAGEGDPMMRYAKVVPPTSRNWVSAVS